MGRQPQGVVTCLGGTFYVQSSVNKKFGFGIYDGGPTTWKDADGYLPAQITTFGRSGATVSITEFADQVSVGGNAVRGGLRPGCDRNPTGNALVADPEPSAGLVPLAAAPGTVAAHGSSVHDYVMAVDRFGEPIRGPASGRWWQPGASTGTSPTCARSGTSNWPNRTDSVPDTALDDAYRSGFIYTQIARSGTHLNTGVNGYEMRIQPRRGRHPGQPLHPRRLLRRPGTAPRGPPGDRLPGANTRTASGRTPGPGPST